SESEKLANAGKEFRPFGFTNDFRSNQPVTDKQQAAPALAAAPAKPPATPHAEEPAIQAPPARPTTKEPEAPATPSRKVIRSGEIEFEIQSFDSAAAAVTKLINRIKGGFIATVNSEKLPNGKVRGSMVVRVPPESLDTLILDLRKELGRM